MGIDAPKIFNAGNLTEIAALTMLLASFAYVGRTVITLTATAGLLLLMATRRVVTHRELGRALVTPFLPLIIIALAVSPFQETMTETLDLWAFGLVYVIARLSKAALDVEVVLISATIVSLAIALLHQASKLGLLDAIPVLEKLAAVHGRNPAGTAAAFGFVALMVIWMLIKQLALRILVGVLFLVFATLILASNVMTGILGVLAVVMAAVTIVFITRLRSPNSRTVFNSMFPIFGGGVAAAGVVFVFLQNFSSSTMPKDLVSGQRDFSNLTGRVEIWGCYRTVVNDGQPGTPGQLWQQTLACVGEDHANLHSTYLQAHLLGGNLGLLAVIFAFSGAVLISMKQVLNSSSREEILNALAGYVFGILGAVFALTESYLFIYIYPAFFVFFASPEIRLRSNNKVETSQGGLQ